MDKQHPRRFPNFSPGFHGKIDQMTVCKWVHQVSWKAADSIKEIFADVAVQSIENQSVPFSYLLRDDLLRECPQAKCSAYGDTRTISSISTAPGWHGISGSVYRNVTDVGTSKHQAGHGGGPWRHSGYGDTRTISSISTAPGWHGISGSKTTGSFPTGFRLCSEPP